MKAKKKVIFYLVMFSLVAIVSFSFGEIVLRFAGFKPKNKLSPLLNIIAKSELISHQYDDKLQWINKPGVYKTINFLKLSNTFSSKPELFSDENKLKDLIGSLLTNSLTIFRRRIQKDKI